jgi:4-hydroxy-3-polyprenylbenzoate decarboxylase
VKKTESITLAMTGASGAQYGLRLLELLLAQDIHVDLMFSQAAKVVIGMETTLDLSARPAEAEKYLSACFDAKQGQLCVYGEKQWTAPMASGSGVNKAMLVCPCTTGTLAAAATGQSRSLIERAIDVTLKERKQLMLVVRETPFSEIHLENMLKLSRMGAIIMPANPGFYHHPESVDDIVNFMVARILDQLEVPHNLIPRWGEKVIRGAG